MTLLEMIDERIENSGPGIRFYSPSELELMGAQSSILRALRCAVEALEKYENTYRLVEAGPPALKHEYTAQEALTQIKSIIEGEI